MTLTVFALHILSTNMHRPNPHLKELQCQSGGEVVERSPRMWEIGVRSPVGTDLSC